MINGPFAPRRWVLLLFSGTGAVVFALLAWFVVSVIDVPERREEPVEPLRPAVAPPDPGVRPPAVAVPGTGLQGDRRPQAQLTAWAGRLTERLDVPRAALEAYGYAEVAVRDESPRCRITWTVLAGIGRVESNHGRFGGASLGEDGRPSRPIYGIPLDGGPGVREIRDTDGGVLDGDTVYDRAVGPMQFIPSTWAQWAADGDGDGKADPQDLDDAALAAARYLCAGNRDLGTAEGYWRAVLAYNASRRYGQDVLDRADHYGRLSRGS